MVEIVAKLGSEDPRSKSRMFDRSFNKENERTAYNVIQAIFEYSRK